MSKNNKIVVLDVDTIVNSSVDMQTFQKLPAIKKLRIYYHAQEIVKIMQSQPL
tara:strand:- start:982 stop:1140 length:159 start_codon:yes stop_codon:yes gene_type:complete